ncbi:MAG: [Fe-Fe] hydrogenase large subunit C-terminal domain-containing protein [Candidatus Caldatribacteriaceae bacterium]
MGIISTLRTSCRDCYKCVRHCPVKAIRVSLGHAEVVEERCILDGRCVLICPQGAKKVRNDLQRVKALLEEGGKVVASLAPSFVAAFPGVRVGQIVSALKTLGFQEVRETAEGAAWVAREHAKLLEEGRTNLISSSCPAINNLICRYFPEQLANLAPVVSPMVAHARLWHQEDEAVRVVFIGPCIAKKGEAEEKEVAGEVEAVLTFEELKDWFQERNLDVSSLPESELDFSPVAWARAFPVEGGLLRSASLETDLLSHDMLVITGVERAKQFLNELKDGRVHFKLIEIMACEGGCIDGPVLRSSLSFYERRNRVIAYTRRSHQGPVKAGREAIDPPSFRRAFSPQPIVNPPVPEEELRRILSLTGKFAPQDELNCGACGYDTCREKAAAVYHGMAEAEMCIPFMRAKAESFSSFLIAVTPNGIVLLDENLRIVDINPALRKMFELTGKLVIGKRVDEFLDPSPFVEVLRTRKAVTREVHYPQYHDLFAQVSVFYLEKPQLLMGVFVDLTKEREREELMEKMREKTLEKAQQVINNQMRVAQEIASLLGETTAETKVLLGKLMKILRGEEVTDE